MSKFTVSLPFSTTMTARSIVGTGVVHEPIEPGGRAGMCYINNSTTAIFEVYSIYPGTCEFSIQFDYSIIKY